MSTPRRLKGYRIRLDPTPDQVVLLSQHAGASRWAYNYALGLKLDALRTRQAAIGELVTLGWSDAAARTMVATRVPNYVGVAR